VELSFAVLADGAVARPDRKLDIYGAGIAQINAFRFPAAHPNITLALRVNLTPQELRTDHQLTVDVIDPDGAPRMQTMNVTIQSDPVALAAAQPTENLGIVLVIEIRNLEFASPGDHSVVLLWDGNELRHMPLNARLAEPPPHLQPGSEGI
jgi:hypothetical protein